MRLLSRAAGASALGVALLSAGSGGVHTVERIPSEEALLRRRIEGLEALLDSARRAPLTHFAETLIVVDERLVDELLRAATPIERVFQGKYRISLSRTDVDFEEGFALVTLAGRASPAHDPQTFAEIKVYGALDILDLDRESGLLRGRMKVVAVDVRRVDVVGLPTPLQRMVEDIGHAKLEDFEDLLSSLEIPIRLQRQVEIPGVGPEGGVTIAALTVPLRASIESVKAFRGKLWISVGISASAGVRPTPEALPRGGGR